MPHKDPEARKAYYRRWRTKNAARDNEYHRAYHHSLKGPQRHSAYEFPLALTCIHCEVTFVLTERPTKTGPLSPYCSTACHAAAHAERDRAMYMETRYGLARDIYLKMLADQGHVCAACREPFPSYSEPKKGRNAVHIDHDHATGAVRGLLCSGCNVAEGKIRKRGEVIARYIARCELDLRDWCVSE